MNFYDLLRVSPKASKKLIKDAYKSLVKKYHPDLYENAGEKLWAEEKIKPINEAYETLMDDNKRLEYDKSLELNTVPVDRKFNNSPIDLGRLISLGIALMYVLVSAIAFGNLVLYILAYLVLPLSAIWFSDELGGFVGSFGAYNISTETPGCLVKILGWVLLLLPIALGILSSFID